MATAPPKITSGMVNLLPNIWVRWLQDLFNVVKAKLDALGTTVAGELVQVSSTGELETSGKTAPSGDIVGTIDTQTLSAKTLTTPTIASFVNANHDHEDSSGGGTVDHSKLTNLDAASSGHTGFQGSLGYTAENVANKETGSTLTDSTTKYPSSATVIDYCSTLGGGDWNTESDTWVYVAANQFKIVGVDRTGRFVVGAKLAWTQTSAYYGYVASSAMSGSDTLVTVAGNAVLNAVITVAKYSYAANPTGFPHWFAYTPTHVGFSSAPSGGTINFSVMGRMCAVNYYPGTVGTSNATSYTATLPIAAEAVNVGGLTYAWMDAGSWGTVVGIWNVAASGTTVTFYTSLAAGGWTNSGSKIAQALFFYEI